jgi:hypothetical protein
MNRLERAEVAQFIKDNLQLSYPTIARMKNIGYSSVARIAQEFEIVRATGRKMPPVVTEDKGSL